MTEIRFVHRPLGIYVENALGALVVLAWRQKYGEVSPTVQAILDKEGLNGFLAKAEDQALLLQGERYFDPHIIHDCLACFGIMAEFYPEFEGVLHELDDFGRSDGFLSTNSSLCWSEDDSPLMLITPDKEAALFDNEYASMDEFIKEVYGKLAPFVPLPDNFSLRDRVVAVSGYYHVENEDYD